MLFRGLKGRDVVVNTTVEDGGFRGTVLTVGLFTVRLSGVTMLHANGRVDELAGIVRLPRSIVTWVQEL